MKLLSTSVLLLWDPAFGYEYIHNGPEHTLSFDQEANLDPFDLAAVVSNPTYGKTRWCGGMNFISKIVFGKNEAGYYFGGLGIVCAYEDGVDPNGPLLRIIEKTDVFSVWMNQVIECNQTDQHHLLAGDDHLRDGVSNLTFYYDQGQFGKVQGFCNLNGKNATVVTGHGTFKPEADTVGTMTLSCGSNHVLVGMQAYFKGGLKAVKGYCTQILHYKSVLDYSSLGVTSIGDYPIRNSIATGLVGQYPVICPDNQFVTSLDLIQTNTSVAEIYTVRVNCGTGSAGPRGKSTTWIKTAMLVPEGAKATITKHYTVYKGRDMPIKSIRQMNVGKITDGSWTALHGMARFDTIGVDRQLNSHTNSASGLALYNRDLWLDSVCPDNQVAVGIYPIHEAAYSKSGLRYVQLLCKALDDRTC